MAINAEINTEPSSELALDVFYGVSSFIVESRAFLEFEIARRFRKLLLILEKVLARFSIIVSTAFINMTSAYAARIKPRGDWVMRVFVSRYNVFLSVVSFSCTIFRFWQLLVDILYLWPFDEFPSIFLFLLYFLLRTSKLYSRKVYFGMQMDNFSFRFYHDYF